MPKNTKMATSIDTSSSYQRKKLFYFIILLEVSTFITISDTQFASESNTVADNDPNTKMPDIAVDSSFSETEDNKFNHKNFYSFTVEDHSGQLVHLNKYNNMVTLVVNVASECGYTDGHYKALIRMKNILGLTDRFEVLAFPCNQFGAQEPGTNADIQKFVHDIYHVNFPVLGKINVKDENVPEPFQYLIASTGVTPNWNFWKYLVNEKGHVMKAWGPWATVEDIFHEVKEVVDNIGFDQPSYNKRHPRSEGEL